MPKFYKNKDMLMIEMNESKLLSPLILVDPVQPDRNAAAAIGPEKLNIFIKAAKSFIKNPSIKYFTKEDITRESMQKTAEKRKMPLIVITAESGKEKEDVAGAKLFKLFNLIMERLEKEGKVNGQWKFNDEKRAAEFFFLFKPEKKIIIKGPPIKLKENVKEFKKRWPRTFIKAGNLYSQRKSKSLKEIISIPKEQLDEMGIKSIRLTK
jgi:tRNA nucleotidyltransferase (CCA-adding enzyme)